MAKSEKTVKLFLTGFNCTQAIVCTYGIKYAIPLDTAAKISCGMAGGHETCGAVLGAAMVLGLKFASEDFADRYFKEYTYEIVADFNDRFKALFGTVRCHELLKRGNMENSHFIEKSTIDQIPFCANIVREASVLR